MKSIQHLVVKLTSTCLILACYGCAGPPLKHPVTFHGIAMIDNNGPVVGGIIDITEMVSRPFMMPSVRRVLTTTTDGNGFYTVTVDNIRGDLVDISIRSKKCEWTPAAGEIYEKKYLRDHVNIEQNFSPASPGYGCD